MNKIIPMIFDVKELEENAKNGDGLSCYILGRSYDSGENGLEQNFEKALYWYNQGKNLEDPRCIYGVGACYYFGDGIKEDKRVAYELFVKAYKPLLELIEQEKNISNRQAFSLFCLGANFYYNGVGTARDLEKSKFYLELASNYGLPRAIKKLQEYMSIYDNEMNIRKKINRKEKG